jgi:hypothetical protein
MKVHIFVDEAGRVLGSTPIPEKRNEGPVAFVNSTPAKEDVKHRTYEIELSDDLAFNTKAETADDFHKRLERHIKSRAELKPISKP